MKKNILIIVTSILFISIFVSIYNNEVKSQETNYVEIQNQKIKTLINIHSFIGINWMDPTGINRSVFSNPEHMNALSDALKNLNADILRYPGGINVLISFWDVPTKDVFESIENQRKKDNPASYRPLHCNSDDYLDFFSFLSFCKKSNLKATVQINTQTFFDKQTKSILPLKAYEKDLKGNKIKNTGKIDWDLVNKAAKSAGEQVKWANDNNYNDVVAYWELGNEDQEISGNHAGYTGDEYAKVSVVFLKQMKASNPSIKVILSNLVALELPDNRPFDFFSNWIRGIFNNSELKTYKQNIFAVASHIYPWGETRRDNSFYAVKRNILNNKDLDSSRILNYHADLIKNSDYKNAVIFMNEFNDTFISNTYIHSWLSAIGNAKIVMGCANNPYCQHSDFHNLLYQGCNANDEYENTGFGVLHYAKSMKNPFLIHPEGKVISLLNEAFKGDILKTSFNNNEFYVVSSSSNKFVNVVLLNQIKPHTLNLYFKGFHNLKYQNSKSLGIDVPEQFTTIDTGDSCSDPTEARILNVIDNAVKVTATKFSYQVTLPKNTISVLTFKVNN